MLCWGLVKTPRGQPPPRGLCSGFGNKRISGNDVTQRVCGSLGDADARRNFYAPGTEAIVGDNQVRPGAGQIFFIVAFPRDAKGLRQPSWPAGQISQIAASVFSI